MFSLRLLCTVLVMVSFWKISTRHVFHLSNFVLCLCPDALSYNSYITLPGMNLTLKLINKMKVLSNKKCKGLQQEIKEDSRRCKTFFPCSWVQRTNIVKINTLQGQSINPMQLQSKSQCHSFVNLSVGGKARGYRQWISEFEASLVYRVSSSATRVIQQSPVLKNKNNNKKVIYVYMWTHGQVVTT